MKTGLLLVLLAGANSTVGNMLLKYSRLSAPPESSWVEKLLSPAFAGAVVFYVVNLILFAKALDSLPVSVGYPILAASGFAMLVVASAIFFSEPLRLMNMVGLGFIVLGIFFLAQTAD